MDHLKSAVRRKLVATPAKRWLLTEPRFVIVGTGRSGTGYISAVLSAAGIKTGHEWWWNRSGNKATRLIGDASWVATFSLDDYYGQIFHQIRDPIKVIGSMADVAARTHEAGTGLFTASRKRYVELTGHPLVDAMRTTVVYVTEGDRVADMVWRVEDVDAELIQLIGKLIDVPITRTVAQAAIHKVDSGADNYPGLGLYDGLSWSDLPADGDTKRQLITHAEKYGYL